MASSVARCRRGRGVRRQNSTALWLHGGRGGGGGEGAREARQCAAASFLLERRGQQGEVVLPSLVRERVNLGKDKPCIVHSRPWGDDREEGGRKGMATTTTTILDDDTTAVSGPTPTSFVLAEAFWRGHLYTDARLRADVLGGDQPGQQRRRDAGDAFGAVRGVLIRSLGTRSRP